MKGLARTDRESIQVLRPEDEGTRAIGEPAGPRLRRGFEDLRTSKFVKDRSECPAQAIACGSFRKRKRRACQIRETQGIEAEMQTLILLVRLSGNARLDSDVERL
jgi:hypothetical protein